MPWHYYYMNLYIFTYGSTNNTVKSLSTKKTAQRSSQRIRSRFLPGSNGTNRTPADPSAPLRLQYNFFRTPFVWQKAVLWIPVIRSDGQNLMPGKGTGVSYPRCVEATLAYVMGRQLSHLGYNLATVYRGYPSLCNGHRQVFHLGYLSHDV